MSAQSQRWGFNRNAQKDLPSRIVAHSHTPGSSDASMTPLGSTTMSDTPTARKPRQEKTDQLDQDKRFMEICKDANLDTARLYCHKNATNINNSLNHNIDMFGNVPLHLSVSQNDHITTCLLLLKGANPNLANKSGVTPLMIAQRMQFSGIEEVLKTCGAQLPDNGPQVFTSHVPPQTPTLANPPGAKDKEQVIYPTQTLFGTFAKTKQIKGGIEDQVTDVEARQTVENFMETGIMILPDAAYLGFQKPLLSVIKKNTFKDCDSAGSTALMKASYAGHKVIVDELLKMGADVDGIDSCGNTALIWAALGGKLGVVKILVENGASIDGGLPFTDGSGVDFKGQLTPLIAAAYRGNLSIVEFLIKEGCDVNLRIGRGKGKSALMIASWGKKKEIVKTLIQNKAYVDPEVEEWFLNGLISMKKILMEKNPWVGTGGPRSESSIMATPSAPGTPRRSSMLDKINFTSADETELITEISTMLTARAGIDPAKFPPPANTESNTPQNRRSQQIGGRNREYRQGMNLEKIIGNNSESVLALAEQMPDSGTELDALWISVFQCVVQLVMAANKNIKHHYITIAAKANHCASEIVRAIEQIDKKTHNNGVKVEIFCDTAVRQKMRECCKIIINDFPKQLMIATRMAIGVWPAPNAVSNMIQEASSLAAACRELVLLGNTLGYFPKSDKKFEITFQAFEEGAPAEVAPSELTTEKDSSLKGGLSYAEYKRQNDLKLIQEMSKSMGVKPANDNEYTNEEELLGDAEFFSSLDNLLKLFVQAAVELKQVHAQHLIEEFINASTLVFTKADTLIEEISNFPLLKDFGDDIMLNEHDIQRLGASGIKLTVTTLPTPLKPFYLSAIDEVNNSTLALMSKAKAAALPGAPTTAATEMLQSSIPCLIAVKKLVTLAKEAAVRVRNTGIEERRKRDAWRKELLANERVKQLFNMWQNQVESDTPMNQKKNISQLDVQDLAMLDDSPDGLVLDDTKKPKGGKLMKLVEVLTSHVPQQGISKFNKDDDFRAAFLMTHHSFTTSLALMDLLFKRYDLTPPYGLTQRLFEIFIDKKVVQVRLKVCQVFLYWIQNHFEEDFADNEFLIIKFREFVQKKVIVDFEQMANQILDVLDKQIAGAPKVKTVIVSPLEKPKPILGTPRFGYDPIANLLTDTRAFLELDPLEFARQLTLLEHELYCKFQSYECLDQIWESHHRKEIAGYKQPKPAVIKRHVPGSANSDISILIRHTNDFTFWVATCVVNNDAIKGRVAALKYFISMAQHCRELNNLTAVTTIVAGLSMGPVSRMHKTWTMLAEKHSKLSETYKDLQELVSPKFQYANYRKCLKEMQPPAIPFLGVYLTDLTFLDLGNPDFLPESHFINFEKRRKVFLLIREIQKYQNTMFPFVPIPQVQEFINKLCDPNRAIGWENSGLIMTEDELYDKSTTVEPKEASSDEDN